MINLNKQFRSNALKDVLKMVSGMYIQQRIVSFIWDRFLKYYCENLGFHYRKKQQQTLINIIIQFRFKTRLEYKISAEWFSNRRALKQWMKF